MSKIQNIVLVHGFWADGSSYGEIIPALLQEGYNVIAVQNPLTSLADDVAATKRVLARLEGPCILVGHSWGGFVITEAGNDEQVAGLVYIAALAPNTGETVVDILSQYEAAPASQYFQVQDGFIWLAQEGVQKAFANDLSAEQAALIYATQTAPSTSLLQATVDTPAWKRKPSWYIISNVDQTIPPDLQRDSAKRIGATAIALDASHVSMISHPEEVLKVIREAAVNSQRTPVL
ncbi:alpha/beta hydrolase [Oscillatoria sp. FACHB-1407]|uniref:alpha/beta fold hydrolase n=1 Tax=Oscillatoria sp. FACHB-1407 TaxID=2692847 RepID=UPI00168A351C|nr:alpha/beta hydrolase [Oscillatoria sp. FACHB-1407]MBD2461193.1 alpha/beta hydrolase [Oscillatoria sp. FACHB-1407]